MQQTCDRIWPCTGLPTREAKRGFLRTQPQETPQLQQDSVGREQTVKGRQIGQYRAEFHRKQKPVPGTSHLPELGCKFLLLHIATEGLYNVFRHWKPPRFSPALFPERTLSAEIFQKHMVWGRCPSQRGGERKAYGGMMNSSHATEASILQWELPSQHINEFLHFI